MSTYATQLYSQEAEESLLGAILINPAAFQEAAVFLQADDFYIHRHRWIWQAVSDLAERREPVDFLTLSDQLEREGKLGECGGPGYLTALIQNTPTSLHAESYARIVEGFAVRRRMLQAANQVAKLAWQEGEDLAGLLEASEKAVSQAGERLQQQELRRLGEVLSGLYDGVSKGALQVEAPEIESGFPDLDRLLGGLQPADLLIVAGRPGVGKTSFLLEVVRHASLVQKKSVALFSLEMSAGQLARRWLAREAGIPLGRLRRGQLEPEEWEPLTASLGRLSELPVYLDDTPTLTPGQLRARCRVLRSRGQLDLIALDYLQLMAGGGKYENRQQEVASISRQLKALAKELAVPVLAAAQLSRAVEQRLDKEPVLSDLRESGALEQDADVVLFLHRLEGLQDPPRVRLTVAKHRSGPTGRLELRFHPAEARFESLAAQGRPA